MEGFDEFVIKNRTELNKVSSRARVLRIHYPINVQDAVNIMRQCRTLEEVVFERKAFERTDPEAKQYLDKWVFVETE
ncbi:TPA: hypothetical protein H1005_03040 [archaeon]|uniref:Uncharacterized protein n=1 Tax=Candidatus Naiadarchaeum limnaeum TaxID=2756139 RepID=A0A832VA71_9ARCH|nr:hypothetical protein [Candidatus Naiadarchaeales archaeon SRR2090153.bin1042]HIK00406.1 hypothetical protein [Candidatus Naiadarchaeum limnaeum]